MIASNRNRLLLTLVVTAAAVAAFWFLALAPKREQAIQLQVQVATEQAKLAATQAEIIGYEQARAAYGRNYATVARLGKAVPADDDVRSLMVQLDSAAARSRVDFMSIDVGTASAAAPASTPSASVAQGDVIPGVVASGAGFSTLPVKLTFKGSYFELAGFFARLERYVGGRGKAVDVTGRLLTINQITLSPDSDDFHDMTADVDATSYLVPEDQGLTNGATPAGLPGAPAAGPQSSGATAPVTTATITGAVR